MLLVSVCCNCLQMRKMILVMLRRRRNGELCSINNGSGALGHCSCPCGPNLFFLPFFLFLLIWRIQLPILPVK
ncbi:hypothetical protein ABIB60_003702 [Hymenobacter sp. UYP22]